MKGKKKWLTVAVMAVAALAATGVLGPVTPALVTALGAALLGAPLPDAAAAAGA